jgi:hypothetical protein
MKTICYIIGGVVGVVLCVLGVRVARQYSVSLNAGKRDALVAKRDALMAELGLLKGRAQAQVEKYVVVSKKA